MKLIDAARKFLSQKSEKKQAFFNREHELKTKLTDLDAKKSSLISAYDPTKPFDAKAIDKIDAEIAAVKKELDVLTQTVKLTPDYDTDAAIQYITGVKAEAAEVIAEKKQAAEKARAKIAEAKRALLEAQAEHFRIVRDANYFASDTNETLAQLNSGIKQQIGVLREKANALDLEIFRLAPETKFNSISDHQSILDAKREELSELRREIQRLEGLVATVNGTITPLDNYRNNNGKTIYFVHDNEQLDAANKGILPR